MCTVTDSQLCILFIGHFRFFTTQLSTIGRTMDIKRFGFCIHKKFLQQLFSINFIVLQLTDRLSV